MKPDQLEQPVVNFGSAVDNTSSRPTHRKQLEKQESPAEEKRAETAAMATALPMKLTVVDEISAEEEDAVSLPLVTRSAAAETPDTCTTTLVAEEGTVETLASVESDPEDGTLTREKELRGGMISWSERLTQKRKVPYLTRKLRLETVMQTRENLHLATAFSTTLQD